MSWLLPRLHMSVVGGGVAGAAAPGSRGGDGVYEAALATTGHRRWR